MQSNVWAGSKNLDRHKMIWDLWKDKANVSYTWYKTLSGIGGVSLTTSLKNDIKWTLPLLWDRLQIECSRPAAFRIPNRVLLFYDFFRRRPDAKFWTNLKDSSFLFFLFIISRYFFPILIWSRWFKKTRIKGCKSIRVLMYQRPYKWG